MKSAFPQVMLVLLSAASAIAQQPQSIRGKVDAVTVYRGQALVTRLADLPGPAGLREIVVTDLPAHVVPGSLYAESADGVEVRSVLYRERPVDRDVREEVRKLDEQLRALQDRLRANQRSSQLIGEHRQFLDKLAAFTAPTANIELTKGVLNAETIKQITAFQFDQRKGMAGDELQLGRELRDIQEQIQLKEREKAELTGGSSKTIREAVVFVNLKNEAGGRLRIRYLVNNSTWFPSYNVRAEEGGKKVTLEYNASIQQLSGEDWPDVAMTLSTATPSLVAMAPVLEPLAIALTPGGMVAKGKAVPDAGNYAENRMQLLQQRKQAELGRNLRNMNPNVQPQQEQAQGQFSAGDQQGANNDADLNELAGQLQVLELVAKDARREHGSARPEPETVSVTYQLASRTSLPSRQDTQLIQVAALPLKAQFYKRATPVLTSYVYDQASITNEGKTVLLAGPVASYMNGQFVGSGAIPTVAIGQDFTVGFGIDTSLRATRELLEKTETVQAGNKVLNFTYRLSLENFGSAPATVRLIDRLPTGKETEVRITLNPPARELSQDTAYQQAERKKGLLRWDVEVPPQAIGTKAVAVEYQFRVEYDKNLGISGLPAASK